MSAVGRTLARALLARAGDGATLLAAAERPWASVTFEGARHAVELELATAATDAFAAGLENLELPLPRHILADLAVEARVDRGDGRTRITLGALALADG